MDSPERAETPTPNPLDAERARLRKEGFTDHTISKILLAREFAAPQATGGAGHGVRPGVLSNLSAVLSHARGILPSFKTDLANMFDRAASPPVRVKAAGYLALKAAIIVVFAYAVRDRLKVGGVMRHDVAGRASIGREQCGLVRMFRS